MIDTTNMVFISPEDVSRLLKEGGSETSAVDDKRFVKDTLNDIWGNLEKIEILCLHIKDSDREIIKDLFEKSFCSITNIAECLDLGLIDNDL